VFIEERKILVIPASSSTTQATASEAVRAACESVKAATAAAAEATANKDKENDRQHDEEEEENTVQYFVTTINFDSDFFAFGRLQPWNYFLTPPPLPTPHLDLIQNKS
jgi:hypothetical protein